MNGMAVRWCSLLGLAMLLVGSDLAAQAPTAGGAVTVEYVAHAAVVIESSGGARVLIDPYNGNRWMGYSFPSGLAVDAVLITHPHYDHDASYVVDSHVPVFRAAARYAVGDVAVIGIADAHRGWQRFRENGSEPYNNVWIVEADGLRFLHPGDNRLPSAELIDRLGAIDVVFVPPFGDASESIAAWSATGARVLVPVHYAIPALSVESFPLPSVSEWLPDSLARFDVGNRHVYDRASMPAKLQAHVYEPAAGVRPWAPGIAAAWEGLVAGWGATTAGDRQAAIGHFRRAIESAPLVITTYVELARALTAAGEAVEAELVLESGLARAAGDDLQPTAVARGLLARLYHERGRDDLAAHQYRMVLKDREDYQPAFQAEARAFLEAR